MDPMDTAKNAATPPPGWNGLLCAEDWRYLSSHLGDERLHDVRILLGECPHGVGAKLVSEIRTLLPGSEPGHALVLALARVVHDADQDRSQVGGWGAEVRGRSRRDAPLRCPVAGAAGREGG